MMECMEDSRTHSLLGAGWGGEDGKTDGPCSDRGAEARGGEDPPSSPDKRAKGPMERGQGALDRGTAPAEP